MGRAYSLDLRERVVAAVAAGESCRAVAATFKVSVASVVKWSQRFRVTGSAAARPVGGNRPYVLSSERLVAQTASGARVNELTSLYPGDVKPDEETDIWCMVIQPSLAQTKSLRTM